MFDLHWELYNFIQHIFLHLGFLGSIASFKSLLYFLYLILWHSLIWFFFLCKWKDLCRHAVDTLWKLIKKKNKWKKKNLSHHTVWYKYLVFSVGNDPRLSVVLLTENEVLFSLYKEGCLDRCSFWECSSKLN